jgi:hypothetical protein
MIFLQNTNFATALVVEVFIILISSIISPIRISFKRKIINEEGRRIVSFNKVFIPYLKVYIFFNILALIGLFLILYLH